MRLKPVNQQVVVIVGANSGIGRATALKFADQGAKVVLSGRAMQSLGDLAEEIQRDGGQAVPFAADVTDFGQMQALANHAVATYGRIDTWVHLAAVSMWATFSDTKPEEFKQIIETNLVGQAYGAMAALPYLRREGSGALIHVTSLEARRSVPFQSAYSASKQGIKGFLGALRMELEQEGVPISVVNIMPASINTPLFDKALTRLGVLPQPLPPVYEPDLVADTILYAAEHPARDLFVGDAAKSFALMQRISPRMAEKSMEKVGFMGQKSNQEKPSTAPNNLYQHIEGHDQIRGEFDMMTKPSMYTRVQNSPWIKWGLGIATVATGAFIATRVIQTRRKQDPLSQARRWVNHRLPWRKNASLIDRIPFLDSLPWLQSRTPMGQVRKWTRRLAKLM